MEENKERRLWNTAGGGGGDQLKVGEMGKAWPRK